jgi:hypothetical protein
MPFLEPRPANLRPKPYIRLKLLPIPSASSSLLPSYSSGGAFRRVKFALNYITVVITLTLHGAIPLLMRQLYDPSTLDFSVVWNTWHCMSAFTTSFCGRGFSLLASTVRDARCNRLRKCGTTRTSRFFGVSRRCSCSVSFRARVLAAAGMTCARHYSDIIVNDIVSFGGLLQPQGSFTHTQ